jgi:hypothetical protein
MNVKYRWGDNERKLKTSYYFQSERGKTRPKFIEPLPNSNLLCAFLWRIHMSNLSLMCHTVGEIMNGTKNFMIFSKWKGHNSAENHWTMFKFEIYCATLRWDNVRKLKISSRGIQKSTDYDQIRTWPVFSHDVFICKILVACMQPLLR